ncbi:MAG: hypothetical protein WCZ47_04770 [Bacilli bacterium]|jgi:heme exporter protein D|nr:hypothetical protein [Erysipelotrichia bacterium]
MKTKITKKEFAWYIVSGILAFLGITLIIFNIIGENISINPQNNWILKAEQAVMNWSNIPLNWRALGLIFFFLGVLMSVIVLLVNAKEAERIVERKLRRQARISAMEKTQEDTNVIEVETSD